MRNTIYYVPGIPVAKIKNTRYWGREIIGKRGWQRSVWGMDFGKRLAEKRKL